MRFGSIGLPELVLFPIVFIVWVLPIAAAVWAIVTLGRIRSSQVEIQARLTAIEQLLQRR